MEKILERYERYSYAERQLVGAETETQVNWSLEYNRLKAKVELLERNHRHYMGEELESMSLKELQNMEQQLDTALKHIRSRKNQLMYESITELQRRVNPLILDTSSNISSQEKAIQEQNNLLAKQIKEKEKNVLAQAQEQAQWGQPNHGPGVSSFLMRQTPCLNISNDGNYQEEARRNELELTLEPIYNSCQLGCFATCN
ncbi:hypothetical protein ACFE04_028558 [Oxalis oulophora]